MINRAVGRLAITVFTTIVCMVVSVKTSSAMDASLIRSASGESVLLLEGRIQSSDVNRLVARLRNRNFREVWLDSIGGSSSAGYAIGREIRSLGLATRVPKDHYCASACVDVFLGGVIRFIDPGGTLMIHPGSSTRYDEFDRDIKTEVKAGRGREHVQKFEQLATAETAEWVRYITEMGASLDLAGYAARVPHSCGIILSRRELIYFNLVNTLGPPPRGYTPSNPNRKC